MTRRLKLVRIVELICLLAFTLQLAHKAGELSLSFNVIHLTALVQITGDGEPPRLSLALLGFAASLAGAWMQRRTKRENLHLAAFALALLGLVSYVNEALRFFAGYDFQFMVDLSPVLLILDWKLYRDASWLPAPAPEPAPEPES